MMANKKKTAGSNITPCWLVRGGKGGIKETDAIKRGQIFVGWPEVGDLDKFKDQKGILEGLNEAFPSEKPSKNRINSAQLNIFAKLIQKGDIVVMPFKKQGIIAIGTVTGDYKYDPSHDSFPNSRTVRWLKKDVSCNSSMAPMTVCGIRKNDVLDLVFKAIK